MTNLTKHSVLLPEPTIERLSEYRRTLLELQIEGKTHLFSHEIASFHSISAVQVRRDLMLIGFSSDTKKGYMICDLVKYISQILDGDTPTNVGIIGMGNLSHGSAKVPDRSSTL